MVFNAGKYICDDNGEKNPAQDEVKTIYRFIFFEKMEYSKRDDACVPLRSRTEGAFSSFRSGPFSLSFDVALSSFCGGPRSLTGFGDASFSNSSTAIEKNEETYVQDSRRNSMTLDTFPHRDHPD